MYNINLVAFTNTLIQLAASHRNHTIVLVRWILTNFPSTYFLYLCKDYETSSFLFGKQSCYESSNTNLNKRAITHTTNQHSMKERDTWAKNITSNLSTARAQKNYLLFEFSILNSIFCRQFNLFNSYLCLSVFHILSNRFLRLVLFKF